MTDPTRPDSDAEPHPMLGESWRKVRTGFGRYWKVGVWAVAFFVTVWGALYLSTRSPGRFWVWWEVLALGLTVVYCGFMFFDWFITGNQLDDVLKSWANGVAALLSLAGILLFLAAACFAWFEPECVEAVKQHVLPVCLGLDEAPGFVGWIKRHWLPLHVTTIIGGVSCFLGINLLIRYCPRDNLTGSQRREYKLRKRESLVAICYSDAPILGSFVIIAVLIVELLRSEADLINLKAFLGGCVAFELLVSNVIFGLGQLQTARARKNT